MLEFSGYARIFRFVPEFSDSKQNFPIRNRIFRFEPEFSDVCQNFPIWARIFLFVPEIFSFMNQFE